MNHIKWTTFPVDKKFHYVYYSPKDNWNSICMKIIFLGGHVYLKVPQGANVMCNTDKTTYSLKHVRQLSPLTVILFLGVTPCDLVDRYQHFGEICYFRLLSRRRKQQVAPKVRVYQITRRHISEGPWKLRIAQVNVLLQGLYFGQVHSDANISYMTPDSRWLLLVAPGLAFRNSTVYIKNIFLFFLFTPEQTYIK
jgi:hypothetical protein